MLVFLHSIIQFCLHSIQLECIITVMNNSERFEGSLPDVEKSAQIQAAERLKSMFQPPEGFEVETIIPEETDEDQTIGISVKDSQHGGGKPFVLIPQFNENGLMVGFMQRLERDQKVPELVGQSISKLALQFAFENDMTQRMGRVVEGNDYSNWKAVPKPELGKLKKLDQ